MRKRPIALLLLVLLLAACGSVSPAPLLVTPTTGLPPGHQLTSIPFPTATTATPPPPPTEAPLPGLRVLSVLVYVQPADISQVNCGQTVTFHYTATFYLNGGQAGAISFIYTTDGGHSSANGSVRSQEGQQAVQVLYSYSVTLPADHTMPRFSEVIVEHPNAVNSNQESVAGHCVVTT